MWYGKGKLKHQSEKDKLGQIKKLHEVFSTFGRGTSALNLATNNLREVLFFGSCLERFRQRSVNPTWRSLQLRLLWYGWRQFFKRETHQLSGQISRSFQKNLTLATNSNLLINFYVEHDMDRQNQHRNPENTNWDRIINLHKCLAHPAAGGAVFPSCRNRY